MRALVKNLSQRKNDGEDLSLELRGQEVDPAKIRRWQRRHGKLKDIVRSFSTNLPMGKSPGYQMTQF